MLMFHDLVWVIVESMNRISAVWIDRIHHRLVKQKFSRDYRLITIPIEIEGNLLLRHKLNVYLDDEKDRVNPFEI